MEAQTHDDMKAVYAWFLCILCLLFWSVGEIIAERLEASNENFQKPTSARSFSIIVIPTNLLRPESLPSRHLEIAEIALLNLTIIIGS